MQRRCVVGLAVAAVAVAGCGSGDDGPRQPRAAGSAELRRQLAGATESTVRDFPATRGRTLAQVAEDLAGAGPQAAMATSVFTPGPNRLAFGLLDEKSGFVYGKTAVYVASGPNGRASGPYPAPADLLVTDPPFRSRQAAAEKDPFAAIYSTQVPFTKPGRRTLLMVVQNRGKLFGATTSINVRSDEQDRIPAPGEPAPEFSTETEALAGGDVASIDTRLPPDDMHQVDASTVLGRKPVAVIFATPQLCESRVCGPVVDIAAQLKAQYGKRMTFIHQEVYVDNQPSKGLREPLRRFNLPTEPWLFVIGRDGRVAARLEGSFGFDAFERAVQAGLR